MSFEVEKIRKRFFIPERDANGNATKKRFPVRYEANTLTVTVYGVDIRFKGSNRSKYFTDSREPKKKFLPEETRAELIRMLGYEEGVSAFRALSRL